MAFLGDYHIHSLNSHKHGIPGRHAKGSIDEISKQASELGLKEIAITDHGFNHQLYCTYRKRLPLLKEECKRAGEKYKINVLLGVEANLISVDGKIDVLPEDLQYIDLVLCGFHNFVKAASVKDKFKLFISNFFKTKVHSRKMLEQNTNAYIKAIENNNIDIITHLNFGLCKTDAVKVGEAAAKKGTLIELNSKYTHLAKSEIDGMISAGVKFIIGSDAHKIERIADFQRSRNLIKEYKIPAENIANLDKLPQFLNYKRK